MKLRRTLLLLLLALLVGRTALGEGMVVEDSAFAALETQFFSQAFGKDTKRVELSDTHTFVYRVETPSNQFLPDVNIQTKTGATLTRDATEMVLVVQSLVETAQYLQEQFPTDFLFNGQAAEKYREDGLRFAIAEPDIWLWSQDGQGVMLPMFFHRQAEGALAEQVCMVAIVNQPEGGAYYALYNGMDCLRQYLRLVPLDASASHFQMATLYWFIGQHVELDALLGEDGTLPAQARQEDETSAGKLPDDTLTD